MTFLGCRGPGVVDEPQCNGPWLRAALAEARAGDMVSMGSCAIDGTFRVPAGVALVGEGPTSSILRSVDPAVAVLVLEPGEPPTRLEGIRVESGSTIGVEATGAGAIDVIDVEVAAREGVGVRLVDVTRVTLERVTIAGPIPTPEGDDHTDPVFTLVRSTAPETVTMLSDLECELITARACTSGDRRETTCPGCGVVRQYCDGCGEWVSVLAGEGLALLGVTEATLTDVDVRGFALLGASVVGPSRASWVRGSIHGNLGTGLLVDGVDLALEEVQIDHTYSAFRSTPAAAGFITGEAAAAQIATRALSVSDNRGFGLIHVGGTFGTSAEHDGFRATTNSLAALWFSDSGGFGLSNSTLADNGMAGVVVVRARDVVIRDTAITGTRARRVLFDAMSSFDLGDGLHIFESLSVQLAGLTLDDNERVGLMLELGTATADTDVCGGPDGVCIDSVTVSGTGAQWGAIAGRAAVEVTPNVLTVQPIGPGRWDTAIVRLGSALDDASVVERVAMIAGVGAIGD